jgi:hypothetical protein
MKYSISEILNICSKLPNEEKVKCLVQNDTAAMRAVLQYALDPRVEWLLPIGAPPYKPCEFPDQEGNLFRDIRKLNLFVRGGDHPTMHILKRETLFIQFIETLDPADAALICSIKDKKLPYKGITAKIVNQAYPGLIMEKEKEGSE